MTSEFISNQWGKDRMQKILLVGLDTATLNTFSGLFDQHKDKFKVITAASFREAPNLVSGMDITMAIIDLKMPDVDDLESLDFLCKHHPKVIFVVMTAFGADGIESKLKSLENCRYHQKPVDIDKLTESIIDELEASVGGQIHGIGLSSFLQMSEMESTSCKLVVQSERSVGFMYLAKGVWLMPNMGL
jgi:DNA-binding NtrC family response regulator